MLDYVFVINFHIIIIIIIIIFINVLPRMPQLHLAVMTCMLGYRGYSCEDSSQAATEQMQYLYTVLLTLSNLGFVPAILVACWRWYFVEALTYLANMIFSSVS